MSSHTNRERIQSALAAVPNEVFLAATKDLLKVLGYQSDRTVALSGDARDFIAEFPAKNPNTASEQFFRENAQSVRLIFQITDDEVAPAPPGYNCASSSSTLFDAGDFDTGNARSFLFVAVELKGERYTRGQYAQLTREINKRFPMPAVVLFRTTTNLLTLSFVHRREHKRDPNRDVLGSVSLIREIDPIDPHRAHLDILADLALDDRLAWMDAHDKLHNFDGLLAAWLNALDTEELNRRFYGEWFTWFERAVEEATFPTQEARTLPPEEYVIRLITRLLFVWFIKEKGLIADELFIEARIADLLVDYDCDTGDSYYRAVLQNLFFATLNTEIDRRGFRKKKNVTHRNFSLYRYQKEMSNPSALLDLFRQTPFINGGLFDCLDSEVATRDGGYRIDCFTDNVTNPRRREYGILSIPNRLFFGDASAGSGHADGLIPLFNRYKFTVEENTPIEQEIALDPELLGKVFENLLAAYNPETRETARKQTGSYYTPRAVVDYMVDESLKRYLEQKVEQTFSSAQKHQKVARQTEMSAPLSQRLDQLFSHTDEPPMFSEDETNALVRAIAEIKVLDPAVGSGAFPMGMLHKLTLALRRLDPDNTRWEQLQKYLAMERTRSAYETDDQEDRDAELKEISTTFEHYRDSDFGRKLYLIQNSIFGVDIQPVACQIAKLRFFISLAIEQEADADAPNYGIKPLPNLETRFIAADTLLKLEDADQQDLFRQQIEVLKTKLAENRERHFHATTRRKKLACGYADKRLREALARELNAAGLPADDAHKIAHWDPYDQNAKADWFDPEYMFGVNEGFDVVIGNPPYVESRNSLLSDELKDSYGNQVRTDWGETLPRGSDLLIYFYARSAMLLSNSGRGCLITQNAWLSTDYGQAFQKFSLGKFSFQKIIDTSAKFFSDAKSQNINAVITIFLKGQLRNIEYGVANRDMAITSKRTIGARQTMKWGHLFSLPQFYADILSKISAISRTGSTITFGQGLNFPLKELNEFGTNVPVIVKDSPFVAFSTDGRVHEREISAGRKNKIPALIMPRGIGDRHYCTFNLCKAFSYSHVELYLSNDLWESEMHYCLWLYLNSSFVWLFREITGRKNLGGGLLKAEVTDMKTLPIDFDFDFADDAKEVFDSIKNRNPMPVSEEIYTKEHLRIDDMVADHFGFSDMRENIRNTLVNQVNFRLTRARPQK